MKYILIAEDDRLNQEILKELLDDSYEIALVDDGEACIESVHKRKPDLLLLDYGMPIINGLEVCRMLREADSYREMPIIMVTGHATDDARNECLETGATEFVSKPFDLFAFKKIVDDMLQN